MVNNNKKRIIDDEGDSDDDYDDELEDEGAPGLYGTYDDGCPDGLKRFNQLLSSALAEAAKLSTHANLLRVSSC